MGMSVSLNTAVTALLAQQAGVDTTSHNIANATTVGYSRQRMRLQAIPGSFVADGIPRPGLGVQLLGIDRVRDLFVDYQLRAQTSLSGQYTAQTEALERVEGILAEPGENGLRANLDRFFNAWRDLSNSPESGPARAAVFQTGQSLALGANRLHAALQQQRIETDQRVRGTVDEINSLTTEVAALNTQIVQLTAQGNGAGDLRDRRDVAIDKLAQLVTLTYVEGDNGSVNVSVGGHELVSGDVAYLVEGVPNLANSSLSDVRFVTDGTALATSSGELRAFIEYRDTYLPARSAELNTLVGALITDINTAHASGFGLDGVTGRDFFDGTTAADIAIDAAVLASTNAIAASSTALGVPGDGSNSLAISDLQYVRGLNGGTATYDEFYASMVAGVGVAVGQVRAQAEAQSLVLEQLSLQRESAAGVNVDEEMVSLVRYQRAFEAASRLIAVADEMLDTLINRTI
jgi:flagellar hook-associated protein 1 FlgK